MSDAVKSAAAASCQSINIKAGELRAEVTKLMTTLARTPENIELMLALIRRAQLIDQEAVMWLKDLPPGWRHKTVAWEDNVPGGDYSKAEVFPGRVDMYPDFWIASVTNMCRTSRLIMASIIVRCAAWVCSPVDYRTTPEYATAARTCVDVMTDIIASVPYHLGWHLTRKDIIARHDLSGFACGSEEVVKGLSGYFLTWPLACVHSQDYATDAQRAWVCGRLKYIGNELGVRYALMLSEVSIPYSCILNGYAHTLEDRLANLDVFRNTAPDQAAIHAHPQRRPGGTAVPQRLKRRAAALVGEARAAHERLRHEPAPAARGHAEAAV